MVVASCRNKYDGTNFISAVPSSLLIAPGLRTIQFLLYFVESQYYSYKFGFGLFDIAQSCVNSVPGTLWPLSGGREGNGMSEKKMRTETFYVW
jgi:hypothetical protein